MVQIRRVLCPVDFFPASERAVDYAVTLARNYEAKLSLLHVVAPIIPSTYEVPVNKKEIEAALKRESTRRLEELAVKARSARISVDYAVRAGDIYEEIKKAVAATRADLIVMGTHGRRGFEQWFLGSVTERLFRSLTVPLLTISKTAKPKGIPLPIRRILVTTDFSEGTSEAMAYAFSIAQEFQAEVSVLHVIRETGEDVSEKYKDILITGIGEQLKQFIPDEAQSWCDVRTRVGIGVPFKIILKILETEHIDLLVMNIHGKNGLDRSLPGSTAERVVRGATCPVLMIPPRTVGKRRKAA